MVSGSIVKPEEVRKSALLRSLSVKEEPCMSQASKRTPFKMHDSNTVACIRHCRKTESLGLRYQIEGKILAPIPVNKKQRRKKLAGKYLWPDVPGNPASALRWVYLAGKGWLAPTVLKESAAVLPLVLKVRADGITDKGDYRPLELEPWEFRLLARRTLERLEQNMTKCEVCK